jgi:hypothetical protein
MFLPDSHAATVVTYAKKRRSAMPTNSSILRLRSQHGGLPEPSISWRRPPVQNNPRSQQNA